MKSGLEISDTWKRRQQRLRFLRSLENRHRQLADRLDGCTRSHRSGACAEHSVGSWRQAISAILAPRRSLNAASWIADVTSV